VIGVDVAGAMISLALRLHPGLDFRRADVHKLPFDDGSFDAVVGNFLILHLGRPEQAIAEFVRVLRPGGSPRRSSCASGNPSIDSSTPTNATTPSSFRSPPSWRPVASRAKTELGRHCPCA